MDLKNYYKIFFLMLIFLSIGFVIYAKNTPEKSFDNYNYYQKALEDQDQYVDNFALASKDGKFGFVNKQNDFIVSPKYEAAQNTLGDYFFVCKDKEGHKCAYMDKKTKKLLTGFKYIGCGNGDISEGFSEGMAKFVVVDENGEWKTGYIDKTGKEVIPAQYLYGGSFNEELANVELIKNGKKKVGYIDKTGQIVIPAKYSYGSSFKNGVAEVRLNKKIVKIDKKGKILNPNKD